MRRLSCALLIVVLLLTACGSGREVATPEPTQVIAAAISATLQPTVTASQTPEPTSTQPPPTPTPTPTPVPPTDTPAPTLTPEPTLPPVVVEQNVPYVPDGRFEQKLDIYLPTRGEGPFPTLFMIHEGGGRKEQLALWGRTFGEEGYAAVSIEYRQWPDYGYPDPVQDAFCALAWVHANAEAYGFDRQNVFAMGHSAGGTLAAMLGTVDDPARYLVDCPYSLSEEAGVRAVVAFTGIFDYPGAVERAPTLNDYASGLLGGGLGEVPEIWAEASAVTWLDGSEPPFLLIHGGGDGTISSGNSKDFALALETTGVEVELLIVPGAKHAEITRSEESLQAVKAFLARLLA